MRNQKVSEVLDLAADVVEQRGWITGVWNNTREDAPVCIEGAIAAALGIEEDLGSQAGTGPYQEFETCPAYRAVQEYLEFEEVDSPLYFWNDAVVSPAVWEDGEEVSPVVLAHSQQEVVETLRAAAAVERAKEESLEGSEVAA